MIESLLLEVATQLAQTDPAQQDPWQVNWPTVFVSVFVAISSALLASFTQRRIARTAVKEAERARNEDHREVARAALVAYELALTHAALSLESTLTDEPGPGFPKDLYELRDKAFPYFRHLREEDQESFRRLYMPITQVHGEIDEDSTDYWRAREVATHVLDELGVPPHRRPDEA